MQSDLLNVKLLSECTEHGIWLIGVDFCSFIRFDIYAF